MDKKLAVGLLAVILEAAALPNGTPSGHLYAAMMGRGVTFDDYTMLLSVAVDAGWVTDRGHLLEVTAKGAELIAESKARDAAAVAASVAVGT